MTEEQHPTSASERKSAHPTGGGRDRRLRTGPDEEGRRRTRSGAVVQRQPTGPQAMSMAQKSLTQMAQSEQVAQIMKQVRGPLMQAAQQAATQAVLSRVTAISDGLTARAQALGEVGGTTVEGTAETVSDTNKMAGGGIKGAVGRLTGRKKGKAREEKPEEESDDGRKRRRATNLDRRRSKGGQPHNNQ